MVVKLFNEVRRIAAVGLETPLRDYEFLNVIALEGWLRMFNCNGRHCDSVTLYILCTLFLATCIVRTIIEVLKFIFFSNYHFWTT